MKNLICFVTVAVVFIPLLVLATVNLTRAYDQSHRPLLVLHCTPVFTPKELADRCQVIGKCEQSYECEAKQ